MKQRAVRPSLTTCHTGPWAGSSDSRRSQTTTTCWRSRTSETDGFTWFEHQATWNRGSSRSRPMNASNQPSASVAGATRIHTDRDVDGEVFGNCIPCQAQLVEVVLELRDEQEAEGNSDFGRSHSAATSAAGECRHEGT